MVPANSWPLVCILGKIAFFAEFRLAFGYGGIFNRQKVFVAECLRLCSVPARCRGRRAARDQKVVFDGVTPGHTPPVFEGFFLTENVSICCF